MKFDVNLHKCTIVIDKSLSTGLAINAASVIGISFGRTVGNLVGPDKASQDGVVYPGVIYAPLPVLLAEGDYLRQLQRRAQEEGDIHSMPFSALAQSCRTYTEYGERLSAAGYEDIALVAIGLIGPKKKITSMTGHLPLFR
ncbi:uncharacterized protein DUF2000 [Gibbsiella quercinecans]|uniref:DUF2000 domain-containing protein n=1 Tax=Gibbsiella quercinecans TaxID=929813 RepID=A0A250B051_9GAMM|nr:DUF2000 domain-containing protein [Gibbsiella quercinecans]ATA19603.1 hypothetical protein AWC35_09755 [Gibbsiella quercinecans]RLM04275.1 hypothetical protein BIY31_19805 [Gibbsiella quercinecans]RLM06477.1 hypothetical protein BIY30_16375 [Gibbsiella quercinecans]TCT83268.1 uncharacterized protein DUF2000 [Gibbsiella quercinecans]